MRWLPCFLVLVACGSDPVGRPASKLPFVEPPTDEAPFGPIAATPQRAGDPETGYRVLVDHGYVTCGVPLDLYERYLSGAMGGARLPGRTGVNRRLPYYLTAARTRRGVTVVGANCLSCHAARLDGELIVGLGDSFGDFTADSGGIASAASTLLPAGAVRDELRRFADRTDAIAPYIQTDTWGVNPADDVALAVFAFRDPDTWEWLDTPRYPLPDRPVPVDVPPLWNVGRKTALYHLGSGRGDHGRLMMSAAAVCTDDRAEAEAIAERFADVRAYLASIEPPEFPGPIDESLAEAGAPVFEHFCAGCHGSPSNDWSAPTRLVPLSEVGTDPMLVERGEVLAGAFAAAYEASFYGEGTDLRFARGYVAPPLRGVWATAPYFHNGSVPTLDAVLDRRLRPRYYRRTFSSRDYDFERVGWRYEELDSGKSAATTRRGRAAIYDTALPGYGNGGHRYGDLLARDERAALLEYLKTL